MLKNRCHTFVQVIPIDFSTLWTLHLKKWTIVILTCTPNHLHNIQAIRASLSASDHFMRNWILCHMPKTKQSIQKRLHCMESVQIRSFFWSVFSCIRTEYRELQSKCPYQVRIQENTDQKNSVFRPFSRSVKNPFFFQDM